MTDYLSLARQRAPQAADAQDNPYLPLAQEQQALQQNRARTVLETALRSDPDLAAERLRVSQASGVPLRVVERNLDELRIKERARAIDLAGMAMDSPVLYRQLTDATFATTSIDDLDTLKQIEQSVGNATRYVMGAAPGGGIVGDLKASLYRSAGAVAGTKRAAVDLIEPWARLVAGDDNWFAEMSTYYAGQGASAEAMVKRLSPPTDSTFGSGVSSGVQSFGQNAKYLPLALAGPGGAALALGGMVMESFGASYNKAADKNLPLWQSLGYASADAMVEYWTEKIPLDALIGGIKQGAPFIKLLGKQMALEIPGEQLATVLQDLNEWATLNPGKPFKDYLAERPDAAAQTLIATVIGTGGNVAVTSGIGNVLDTISGPQWRQNVTQGYADLLQEQLRVAGQSALRERSPEQFRSLVQQITEASEGAPKSVYVDGGVLQQLPAEVFNQLPAAVQAQVEQAAATGDVVEIPMADVLTLAPGTPLEQVLNQHARMDPFADSLADTQAAGAKAQEFLKQEAERVIQQASDQEAFRASSEAVKASILGELNTAGRYRPAVSEGMATWATAFYTTMAARVGLTPEQFYQQYRLRILGAPSGQGPVLNAEGQDALAYAKQFENSAPQGERADDFSWSARALTTAEISALAGGMQAAQDWMSSGQLDPAQSDLTRPVVAAYDENGRLVVWDGVHRIASATLRNAPLRVVIGTPATDVLEQRAESPIPPRVAEVADISSARVTAGTRKWPTNRDFKLALQAAVRAVTGTRDLTKDTPEVRAYLVRQLLKEAREALVTNANAVGWYDEKVTTALEVVSAIHPELKTDEQSRFAFTWALAVTSNGVKVNKNFELAERAYTYWKANGVMPTANIGVGTAASKIHEALATYNDLIQRWGYERFKSFATTLQPNRDVLAAFGRKVSGEGMDTQVYGAGVVGPKIGNGFFMNLYGEFGQLTMDRWWVRMWGRLTGDLVVVDRQAIAESRAAFVSIVEMIKADKAATTVVEQAIKTRLGKGDPIAMAKAIMKATTKKEVRDTLATVLPATPEREAAVAGVRKVKDFVSIGDELRKAAKGYYMTLDGQIEVPGGSKRRDMMRAVSQSVLAELQKDQPTLTMADFQALMWYPEKTLYDSAGAQSEESEEGYEDDEAPDYANAAIGLARQQGVSDAAINAAVEQARSDIQARQRARRSGRGTGDVPPEGGAGPRDTAGGVDGRLEQAGDGAGRSAGTGPAPLPGAPVIEGATGPDPRLVAVAEQYARDNGIDLKRQAEYVQVDPERAARIAQAYAEMAHAPQDPAVKEAYENLIKQTVAQYRALEAAGYKFWFIDPTNDPYKSPFDAMREMRAAQTMGVFPTVAGFGSGATDVDISDNPLMGDTGITWPYGSVDGELKPVLANDLFRAVHDAFGHGLEGAGFRAQGEENAWQAHARLFTGTAVAAITSETRGQNSWVNFGPYGETNRTAKAEDTVFADQKTGLMPEWTWAEGRAGDMQSGVLEQGPRGTFSPKSLELVLNPNANLSTFFHETGHFFLEVMADIASQPNAPAQIVEDMNAFLKWAGVPDLATWNALDLDGKRPYHERWAESIEQYVMEGQAPSVELQPLMRRFATWMKAVYKSIQQMLADKPDAEQTPLNDDIRRVMDRLLATDEQIAQANEVAGLLPNLEADAEAAERLNKRSMADLKWAVKARDQVIATLRKQAAAIEKGIREAVTIEVDQSPEMRAKRALDALTVSPEYAGTLAGHKALRKAAETTAREEVKAALLAQNPDAKGLIKGQLLAKNKRDIDNKVDAAMIQWDTANPTPKRPVNATDQDVATIADSFGFESVEAMMQAIDAFGSRRDAIDGLTEQRMLEEHGDLIDERAIREAANEAVHNEARARSLASELRTQNEMLGTRTDTGETNAKGSRITVNALVEAAKQFAANVVARTTLRDLKAKAWQHTAAERRAGKAWQAATAAGKTAEAVKAKQDQVLNNAAAKAAVDAQAEARKIIEFFRRVAQGNDEKVVEKGRDPDIVNAARAVLAAYGLETPASKGAQAYLEALQTNDPDTYAVVAPMVAAASQNAQPLDALTFEELQALNEEIQAMWFLAKRSRQMEVDGDLMDVEDAADEVYARLEEIGIPDEIPGETGALTKVELLARQWLQQIPALGRRVEQWAEAKDGKFGGPFLRLLFQPVKDAADRYRADRLAYRKKFQALVDDIAPMMRNEVIAAPELNYTFGRGHNGIGVAELLHAILHTGNASNKRKLLLGRGWATDNGDGTLDTSRWDAFIARMANEGKLTPAHYNFVQGVWDLMEQTKPLAQKTHRDVFGRYFAEVTAESFVDPWGQTRSGGYVPAQADPLLVQDADLRELLETENAGMSQAFPATNKGFTKGRVEYNRPLKLDLRSLPQHIDKVLLFSHMEPAVRGAAKLLRQKNVSQPLARVDPAAMGGMLKPWLNRSARQTVETPISADAGLNRLASTIRGRVGMALMFGNVSNTLQQFTGFLSASLKVKPSLMRRAAAQYIADPGKFKDSVWALSPYMADRASNEVAVLSDTLEAILINPSVYERAEQWTRRHGYFLQTALDNQMSPIIWTAAYNQALAEGMDERMAIRYADGVIRQTQGSTLPEDVSRIETGPAYARLFTQFIGYFNMLANTNATSLQQIADEQGLNKGAGKAFGVVMLGLLTPIWVAEAIAHAMRGGPEDEDDDGYLDDWLAAVFGFGTIRGMLAGVPFLGAAAQSAVNRFNDQPADDKFSLSPTVSVLESAVGAPASVYKAIADGASAQKAVRDVSALITVATGLPAMTAARPLGYAAGLAQGKIEPTGPVDAARGLVTGTASPKSKQP